MEGLSVAANGLAVVSVAFQLAEACIKLYRFWETVEDAPQGIKAVKEDLKYLVKTFKRIESNSGVVSECIAEGILHCQSKVLELTEIVEKFEAGFRSSSRKKRKWAAFKAASQSQHIERFRNSLSDAKSTLALALLQQCVEQLQSQPQSRSIGLMTWTGIYENQPQKSVMVRRKPSAFSVQSVQEIASLKHERYSNSPHVEQTTLREMISSPVETSKSAMANFEQAIIAQDMPELGLEQLMLLCVQQTALRRFNSGSLEIFAQDGYTVDFTGAIQSRTFVYAESQRYQIHHHATKYRTAFGCLWIRITTMYTQDRIGAAQRKTQSVKSFVFYPTSRLQYFGIRNGVEFVMASAGRSWLFNCRLTVTRARPEDSRIFRLCKKGKMQKVERLLREGEGSVVDTDPKGWKPLHYAAAHGHVELCKMLIEAGADKTALVYEGPTESVLTPISLFVALSSTSHADEKISMLRLFADCIDLSDDTGDGWNVHEWLKRAYAKEKVPISENSITWLLTTTANEEYVDMNGRSVWNALQHAVRSVLCHAQQNEAINNILALSADERDSISQPCYTALGQLLAFRVSCRVLVPMVVAAGSFLRMRGFDWLQDDMTQRQYLQALPNIYTAWCNALLDSVTKVEKYMHLELEQCLEQLPWTRKDLINAISQQHTVMEGQGQGDMKDICTQCYADYGSFPEALVSPARISTKECIETWHELDCKCADLQSNTTHPTELTHYSGTCTNTEETGADDDEEEFYEAEAYRFSKTDVPLQDARDILTGVATTLYRAHGRIWMGQYSVNEILCASCFLRRERYTDESGIIAEFPPIPEHYHGLRFKWGN